jgi:DNA polymerase III alpha subunit
MIADKFGQLIFSENDLCDLIMQGSNLCDFKHTIVDSTIDLNSIEQVLDNPPNLIRNQTPDMDITDWDRLQQNCWHMPDEYKQLDIAEYVLSLCQTESELQRCGAELLLYQERNLFDLLCYLKYLVDVMVKHNIIWGVGRGSGVASYVLYKLGVHRIDSLYYNLDVAEFLR